MSVLMMIQLSVLYSAVLVLAFALVLILVSYLMRKKEELNVVNKLAEELEEKYEARKENIKTMLQDTWGYENAELEEKTDVLFKSERRFYRAMIEIFAGRNMDVLNKFHRYLKGLFSPYEALSYQKKQENVEKPEEAAQVDVKKVHSTTTENTVDSEEQKAREEILSSRAEAADVNHSEEALLHIVFKKYAALYDRPCEPDQVFTPGQIRKVLAQIEDDPSAIVATVKKNKLYKKLSASHDALEKDYEKSMRVLNSVFKEYTAAFGIDHGNKDILSLDEIVGLIAFEDKVEEPEVTETAEEEKAEAPSEKVVEEDGHVDVRMELPEAMMSESAEEIKVDKGIEQNHEKISALEAAQTKVSAEEDENQDRRVLSVDAVEQAVPAEQK